ncbi:MAG: hypothetical protein Ct9H300mP12_16970 [Acidimicrobiales bacterium]|nr:MAG: hypothetical protein Ct9H300mP12_16970 [Acidimicrobiales bacterium]
MEFGGRGLAMFQIANRGKGSIVLDLQQDEGRAILDDLIARPTCYPELPTRSSRATRIPTRGGPSTRTSSTPT